MGDHDEGILSNEKRRCTAQSGGIRMRMDICRGGAKGEQKSVFKIFVEQFADLLVWILMIAAGISLFSGDVESAIVIFAVLILNAVLGTVQSVKAEKSLKALKSLSSPHAHVLRDGNSFYTGSSRGCFAAGGRRYGRCGCTNTVQSLVTG